MNKSVKIMIRERICSCAWCVNASKQLDEEGLRYECPYKFLPVWALQCCENFKADEFKYNQIRSEK